MAPRKAEISENNKLHSFEILEELDISVVKISFQIEAVGNKTEYAEVYPA